MQQRAVPAPGGRAHLDRCEHAHPSDPAQPLGDLAVDLEAVVGVPSADPLERLAAHREVRSPHVRSAGIVAVEPVESRHEHLGDQPALPVRAIEHHVAAHGYDPVLIAAHEARNPVRRDDGVGVGESDDLAARRAEPADQRPAVIAARLVDDVHAAAPGHVGGAVGAGVVDDGDLDLPRVVLREQGIQATGEQALLVVGRNDDRDVDARRPSLPRARPGRGHTRGARGAQDASTRSAGCPGDSPRNSTHAFLMQG